MPPAMVLKSMDKNSDALNLGVLEKNAGFPKWNPAFFYYIIAIITKFKTNNPVATQRIG